LNVDRKKQKEKREKAGGEDFMMPKMSKREREKKKEWR
jgi:hypothetical protein